VNCWASPGSWTRRSATSRSGNGCAASWTWLHRPALLFADEPTIGLDVEAKLVVRNLFRDINRTLGTTIVLTSHDMVDVEALSERVVIVKGGRKAFDGDLGELRSHAGVGAEVGLDEVMARVFSDEGRS
jgi:ABC-2 type transport system ATP-binding protein